MQAYRFVSGVRAVAKDTDPYGTKETPDNNWIKTGSHVMIVGAEARNMAQTYPRDAKPDATKPHVMPVK